MKPSAQSERQLNIVVLEDEAVTRSLLASSLSQIAGCKVIEFASATLFLQHVAADPSLRVDVIFSDIDMPRINGVELLRMIRTGGTRLPRDTQVVMISSHHTDEVVGSALALDAADFVVKPFCQEQLQSLLEKSQGRVANVKPEIAYKVINTSGLVAKNEKTHELLSEEELDFIRRLF